MLKPGVEEVLEKRTPVELSPGLLLINRTDSELYTTNCITGVLLLAEHELGQHFRVCIYRDNPFSQEITYRSITWILNIAEQCTALHPR